MSSNDDYRRFESLTYEDFRRLACDPALSPHEKIGFPDSYREGYESRILEDIVEKLPTLNRRECVVVGCGCSGLLGLLLDLCRRSGHTLVAVDSAEMLQQVPEQIGLHKVSGKFPDECQALLAEWHGRVDALLVYSVFHYVFAGQNPFDFVDCALRLLAPGGRLLIGDVPNVSKRKRFLATPAGIAFHQAVAGRGAMPDVVFNVPEPGKIDDSVITSILLRCRSAGFDAYVLPQAHGLPMATRREDILVVRP